MQPQMINVNDNDINGANHLTVKGKISKLIVMCSKDMLHRGD